MIKETLAIHRVPVEQHRFDLLTSDNDNDPTPRPDMTNVSMPDIIMWLCDAEYWEFVVTKHGDPDNVFMRGFAYKAMRPVHEGGEYLLAGFEDNAAGVIERAERW